MKLARVYQYAIVTGEDNFFQEFVCQRVNGKHFANRMFTLTGREYFRSYTRMYISLICTYGEGSRRIVYNSGCINIRNAVSCLILILLVR